MKIKYRTWHYSRIEKVIIEKETERSVWENGQRRAKRSDFYNYFDTFEEAKQFLIALRKNKILQIKHSLTLNEKKLSELLEMTECPEQTQ